MEYNNKLVDCKSKAEREAAEAPLMVVEVEITEYEQDYEGYDDEEDDYVDGEEEEIASSFSSSSSPLSIDNVLVDIRKQKQLFCLCMCTVCNDESEQKQQLVSLQFVHHAKVAFFCQECDTVLENWGQLWLPETVRDLKRCLQCPYLIAGCSRCLKITSAAARLVCSDCGNKECVYLDQFVPTPPALTSQTQYDMVVKFDGCMCLITLEKFCQSASHAIATHTLPDPPLWDERLEQPCPHRCPGDTDLCRTSIIHDLHHYMILGRRVYDSLDEWRRHLSSCSSRQRLFEVFAGTNPANPSPLRPMRKRRP